MSLWRGQCPDKNAHIIHRCKRRAGHRGLHASAVVPRDMERPRQSWHWADSLDMPTLLPGVVLYRVPEWSLPLTRLWFAFLRHGRPERSGLTRAPGGRLLGATLSVGRWTLSLVRLAPAPCGTSGHWTRTVGRWRVTGWRTLRCVPVDVHRLTREADGRTGIVLTVASRALLVATERSRAGCREAER